MKGEEKGKMEKENGQGPGWSIGEERGWTEQKTPTCSCKQGSLTQAKMMIFTLRWNML